MLQENPPTSRVQTQSRIRPPVREVWFLLAAPADVRELSQLLHRNHLVARMLPAGAAATSELPDGASLPLALVADLEASSHLSAAWRDWMDWHQVPLVALLAEDSLTNHLRARELRCSHALTLPVDAARLVLLLEELSCTCSDEPWRVLLVSEDAEEQRGMAEALRAVGVDPCPVTHSSQLLQALDASMPEVILLGAVSSIEPAACMGVIRARNRDLADAILVLDTDGISGDSASNGPLQDLVVRMGATVARSRRMHCHTSGLRRLLSEQTRLNAAINAHAIFSITDGGGNILEINDKFLEISGYAEQELLGNNHRLLKSGLHDAGFYRQMWRTILSGAVWHGEICNRRKDGSLYWVESTITPVLDAMGSPQGYVSLRTDITKVKTQQLILQRLAAISNLTDADLLDAAVAWLAGSLHVRLAFVAVTEGAQPGMLRLLALWDRSALQPQRELGMAGTPCEIVLQEGLALFVTGMAELFPAAGLPGGDSIDSFLGVALRDHDGKVVGMVGIMDDKPLRDWRDKQEWLRVLAPRIEHQLQRGRFQRELLRREERYRTLTENMPGMVYRVGARWIIEFVSGSFPICGHDAEYFLDSRGNWLKLVHPDDRLRVMDEAAALEREPRSIIQQYRIRHTDGSVRWVSDHKRSLFDPTGVFLGVDGVLFDITAIKQIELANAIDKERLTRSQRYANIGTWDWNIQTSELYWTDRIPVLFGYSEGGLGTTYENFLNAVHPEDRTLVKNAVERCIREGVPYEVEHRVVWPDGTERWLLERGDVIRDEQGSPLHMLGVVQDIHDRKLAELSLAERDLLLNEAQALAHLGNWRADMRSGELFWSDEIFRIFGLEPGQFAPTVAGFRATVHPDDLPGLLEAEQRARITGVLDKVHRILRPDGSIRHVHELARASFDANGEVSRLAGTVQDVTEQVKAQHALIKAREEAENANRAKTEFLSSMSHELRTPMNAILGFSQLLEIDPTLDRKQSESISEIRRAGNHLLQLINEVLDLARIESGIYVMSTEPVVLPELIRECYALVQPMAAARDIEIVVDVEGSPAVLADHTRLKQVLLNLLSNAVKYNRVAGRVEIGTRESGHGRLRILVRDTGMGIPEASRHRIFDAFTRLHEEQVRVEGTGIGLTITRKLVELMGGRIEFSSTVGSGSCFEVELPLAEGWNDTRQQAAALMPGKPAEAVVLQQRPTVLLVDDNPANLRLVARVLERVPEVDLLTAYSASLGLELARAHKPALVLLDINMPDMDGYKLLKLIQQDSVLRDIPVFAITANAMPSDIEKGRSAGFAEYLTKPLDLQYFVAQIKLQLGLPD
jgi:PAS domain S-box-containing protein